MDLRVDGERGLGLPGKTRLSRTRYASAVGPLPRPLSSAVALPALRDFQAAKGPQETGQNDGPTRDALVKAHDPE